MSLEKNSNFFFLLIIKLKLIKNINPFPPYNMQKTSKKPNIIQISLSSSSQLSPNSNPKRSFNPFLRPPPTSEISLYSHKEDPIKQLEYDSIIQNLERKFEGLLLENKQLTEEMNSLSLSDQSSIDFRQIEFVSVESLPMHKETQSIDFLDNKGFMLQKAIEEKAKMEASLFQTVNKLKTEKKRLKSELSYKKQEAYHLEKCIKTHKDKKVFDISIRPDGDCWKRRYYEMQKLMEKKNREFEEIEKSYQQKIKECYNEMDRLRLEKQGERSIGGFNNTQRKLRNSDGRIEELMDYIKELEERLLEKDKRR